MTDHIERDGPGRRNYDKMKCPNCDLLWSNLDKERKASREYICSRILEVKEDVAAVDSKLEKSVVSHGSFVPRWMFLSVFGALITVAGWWFGSMTATVKESQIEVKKSLEVIHRRVTDTDNGREALKDSLIELKWSVNGLATRMSEVEKRLSK